jgi:hypothetical protein
MSIIYENYGSFMSLGAFKILTCPNVTLLAERFYLCVLSIIVDVVLSIVLIISLFNFKKIESKMSAINTFFNSCNYI